MAPGTKAKVLKLAAEMLGGPRKLRSFLGVPSADLARWLSGVEPPPQEAFLKSLELLLDDLDGGGRRLARLKRGRKEAVRILKLRGDEPAEG